MQSRSDAAAINAELIQYTNLLRELFYDADVNTLLAIRNKEARKILNNPSEKSSRFFTNLRQAIRLLNSLQSLRRELDVGQRNASLGAVEAVYMSALELSKRVLEKEDLNWRSELSVTNIELLIRAIESTRRYYMAPTNQIAIDKIIEAALEIYRHSHPTVGKTRFGGGLVMLAVSLVPLTAEGLTLLAIAVLVNFGLGGTIITAFGAANLYQERHPTYQLLLPCLTMP